MMTRSTLIARSLRFYWRTHLGVVAGAAVASAVLVGALVVGDSVRHSLRTFALLRLGDVEYAVAPYDRFFRDSLVASPWSSAFSRLRAPVLRLRGLAVNDESAARANRVAVLGVDVRFWRLGGADDLLADLGDDSVVLNQRLARHLGIDVRDTVLIRVDKPSALPRDAPLSTDADASVAFRLTVGAIASDAQLGRFSLQANQIAPFNAFVGLRWLQEKVGLKGRCNVLLVGSGRDAGPIPWDWGLPDMELELRELPKQNALELRTERIFLDPPAAEAARKASPKAYGVLTYFVNELRVGGRATPYSVVAAVGEGGPPELAPEGMADDEILINTWLANDLAAKAGDTVELTYYVVGAMRKLTEKTSRFRVRAVLPIAGAAADRELMPQFPGVADSENCRDWEPGIPIDLKKIRDKDEDYWDAHRGTPKAFVTLAAGQRMWANRFGNLTAVRYPASAGTRDEVAAAILDRLDPASVGLFPRPVRAEALAASGQALDFGQLFIGLSFFLIVAALLLTGLLFAFGVEQRSEEVGTLLAVGYRPSAVRRLLLAEGGLLAVVGGAIGTVCGALYTLVVLRALATVWSGAVAGTPALYFHASPATLAIGGASSVVVALGAVWLVLRRQARRPARELLAASGADAPKLRRGGIAVWIGLVAVAAAVAIVAWAGASQDRRAAGAFFGAGGLLLVGGLCLSHAFLTRLGGSAARLSLAGLGRRNCARRRGRSLAVIGLLACGTFLVVAVGANRRDPGSEVLRRDSGTGGFAFLGETALPVFGDLNTQDGRDAFNLDADEMRDVGVAALRVREGDDASCLNLNRAQTPRLLGVRPDELAARGAFGFGKTLGVERDASPWLLLNVRQDDVTVPCIGDEATLVWGLGKGLGDTIPYTDERGRTFQLGVVGVLANSVLQGSLLVSEANFEARFPSEDGYRFFLIDAPPERREKVAGTLTRAMEDMGLELTPTATRLAELGAVQNTYLSIFQALGGLGLLLGSVGLGVVVLRNVLERRSELALLRAVGYRKRALRWLVLAEHWWLVVLGLGCGVVAAIVAVVPALRSPGATMPYVSLPLTLLAVVGSAVGWTWLAAAWALRSPLLPALRNE